MPIKTQADLPANAILEHENIFVIDEKRASHQDIRPIAIGILNLMPLKEDTELQLLRSLSNTPLQVDVTFLMVTSHVAKNTSKSHLNAFYQSYEDIKDSNLDGLIITGAPLETNRYEDVDYWDELCKIMEWSKTHVTSTLHLCWGAQAGLYYHYGIDKQRLPEKLSGIYAHRVTRPKNPLVRGFDEVFYAPHSRNTTVRREDILAQPKLRILAESDEAGVHLVSTESGRRIFIFGHMEYDRDTLKGEYLRDLNAGINPKVPANYFVDDDPEKPILFNWRSHANLLFSNWLNYYVYQETPYNLSELQAEMAK